MFGWLRSLVSAAAVVELHSGRIRVRDISAGKVWDFEPLLSVDGEGRVVAIGRLVPASAVRTHAPFASPDALAEEPRIAQLILMHAYSSLGPNAWLKPAPRVVLYIANDVGNHVRHIADQALIELSGSAGARTTVIHRGRAISDADAIELLDASR